MEGLNSPSTVQSGTNASFFNPLLISMLGIVATVIAIMAYHLLLANYCIKRRAANGDAAQPPPPTGVDEKVIESIPILAFSVCGVNQEGGECAVCLGEFEEEDSVRLLPNCTHAFHVSCIDQWFAAHTSCPLCRMPVLRHKTDSAPASPDLAVDPINRGESSGTSGSVEPSSTGQSVGLLRNCASLMTPMERRSSSARLKRSLSMDPTVVVIDLERTNCPGATSFSSSSTDISIRRSGSLSHFDHKWLRSISLLRTGVASNHTNSILPF